LLSALIRRGNRLTDANLTALIVLSARGVVGVADGHRRPISG
jgi:hypothetical protein